MTKADYLNKIKMELFQAEKHFDVFKDHIVVAEGLIVKGFNENKINNPYMQNGLRVLSAFRTNGRIRTTMKLLEEAMKEYE
jgi:hypothetical protein